GLHAADPARGQRQPGRADADEGSQAPAGRSRVGRKEPEAARGTDGSTRGSRNSSRPVSHDALARGDHARAALRDPVLVPVVILIWDAVGLFVLYPLARLLALTFWDGGPTLAAVRGLAGK